MSEHVDQSELLRLLGGTLDPSKVEEAYGHLAFCGDCAAMLESLSQIRSGFDGAWSEFLDAISGMDAARALAAVPARQSDAMGSESASAFPIRLALRILVDRVKAVAEIASENVAQIAGPYRLTPVHLPAGAGESGRPEGGPLAEIHIVGPRIGSATVVADSKRNAISVLLRPPDETTVREFLEQFAPRAILLDPEGRRRREVPFVRIEGADYLLAEFDDLEQSSWVVGLELGP